MQSKLYFEKVYPALGDIGDTTLSAVVLRLSKCEWTVDYNPTILQELGWLFDIWDYNENVLYYQSDDVGMAILQYLQK